MKVSRIDAIMQEASEALVARRYFDCERLCLRSLRLAHAADDFERMARIVLPLQEARRQKRDLAFDTGLVIILDSELPTGRKLIPACYLICPPRVGSDGRLLREAADRKEVPVVIVVREPTTRDGMWPIVAVGPETVRVRMSPPQPTPVKKKPAKPKAAPETNGLPPAMPIPSIRWFREAGEALGDAAIAQVAHIGDPVARVAALLDRLQTHPDHEKLHQRLAEACRLAARLGRRTPVASRSQYSPDDDDEFA